MWGQGLSNIVASYLPDGEEEPEAIGGVNFEKGKKNIENTFPHIEGNEDEAMSSVVPRSADVVGDGFKRAVGSDDFGWLNKHREGWEPRDDLPNYVIAEGPDVTVKLIENVKDKNAKRCLLAALFDMGGGMIDQVLGRISYKDEDLLRLTDYRPELASSHEKLFNILDKIKEPSQQNEVVRGGVINLFKAGMHDLVPPLVNALAGRASKSGSLKEGVIKQAFYEGIDSDVQSFVEEYHEDSAITAEVYAEGLKHAWDGGELKPVLTFLLIRADKGDLEMTKKGESVHAFLGVPPIH